MTWFSVERFLSMANESNDQEPAFQDALNGAESLSHNSTARYDRLWHLGNHLRSITSPQGQASAEMHPEHAAIVLTEDEQRFIAAASRHPLPSSVANAIQRLALARRNPSQLQSFNQALSARRTVLEATLRQLRRSSDPNDPSTSLGRRVTARVAATREERATDALPEPLPNRPSEPRYIFFANAAPSVRPGVPRVLHNSLGEHRPRVMRNESTTTQNVNTMSSQMSSDDEFHRPRPADTAHGSYRVRRRINSRGQEHVTNINWHDSHSEVAPDPWTWVDAARHGRPQHTPGSEQHVPPADPTSGGQRRHRGWGNVFFFIRTKINTKTTFQPA